MIKTMSPLTCPDIGRRHESDHNRRDPKRITYSLPGGSPRLSIASSSRSGTVAECLCELEAATREWQAGCLGGGIPRSALASSRDPASRIACVAVVGMLLIFGMLAYLLLSEVKVGPRRVHRLHSVLERMPPDAQFER